MYVGVDYYPEHWPRDRWPLDAKLMRKAGLNVVRLAEFAWSRMEPEEGRYDFTWLDRAISILNREGIRVILGTPTASMPPWVARKYPDTLSMGKDGTRDAYGHRKYACLCSRNYRRLSQRITTAMARHFRGNPAVIGWQTDNEFDAHQCCCRLCVGDFRRWLKEKYGSIAKLGRAWGTVFWSHEYRSFDEIPFPLSDKTFNLGHAMDYRRFVTFANARFQREQVRILRKLCPEHFITHNFQESWHDLDYFEMAKDLDFVAWNSYPIWGKPSFPHSASAFADTLRGLKGRNFWTMEQVCGNQGWAYMSRSVRPGEVKRLMFQQIAHGSDGFLWFAWRTCPFGWEQNAHGVLSYDGVPRRRYAEVAEAARTAHGIERELAGTSPRAEAAMILDYESSFSLGMHPGFIENAPGWWLEPGKSAVLNNYQAQFMRYYRALLRSGVNVDVISRDGDFGGYRAIIAPELVIMRDETAKKLVRYVNSGGVLLTDLRTGLRNEFNACHQRLLPGLLRETLKVRIEEYESLPEDSAIAGTKELKGSFRGYIGCDWVIPEGARVLAGYRTDYLREFAAVTCASSGKGAAYYVGTIAREEGFYDSLIAHVLGRARVAVPPRPPEGVEMVSREKEGSRLIFCLNHASVSRAVRLPKGGKLRALVGPAPRAGRLNLPAGAIAVLQTRTARP